MTAPYLLPVPGQPAVRRNRDWLALADQVRIRRRVLGLRQIDLQHRGGPGPGVVQAIEQHKRTDIGRGTLLRVDRALAWPEGMCGHILNGGTVTEPEAADAADTATPTPPAPAPAATADDVRELLRLTGDLAGRLAGMPSTPARDALRAAAVELLRNPDGG